VSHHEMNRGFGGALRTGFARSRGRFVTLITADGEVGADQAVNLLRDIGDADLIVSRRERSVATHRTVLTAGANLVSRMLTGLSPEGLNGIYVVRGDVLRRMRFVSDTGLVNFEVYTQCRDWGCQVRSGVTQIRPRLSGESKVTNTRTVLKLLRDMLRLRIARSRMRRD